MKVLLVNGSPKANGNTARALAEVAEQLNAEGIDTEVFQLGAKPIRRLHRLRPVRQAWRSMHL